MRIEQDAWNSIKWILRQNWCIYDIHECCKIMWNFSYLERYLNIVIKKCCCSMPAWKHLNAINKSNLTIFFMYSYRIYTICRIWRTIRKSPCEKDTCVLTANNRNYIAKLHCNTMKMFICFCLMLKQTIHILIGFMAIKCCCMLVVSGNFIVVKHQWVWVNSHTCAFSSACHANEQNEWSEWIGNLLVYISITMSM